MVAGTMDLSLTQWGELGPLWRRNLGFPKYEISAWASQQVRGSQGRHGVEAMRA